MSLPLMKNYINGEWVESNSKEIGDVWNPAQGEKIAQVAYGTSEDVDKAVKAAKDAYWEWRTTPPLTTMRQPVTEMAERATRLLLEQMDFTIRRSTIQGKQQNTT